MLESGAVMNARAALLASLIAALGPGLHAQSLPSRAELQARAPTRTIRSRTMPSRRAFFRRFGLSGCRDLAPSRYTDMIADAKERPAHLPPQ